MEKLDITQRNRDPKFYNRDRDMETALAWNALKKFFEKRNEGILFEYIKSVRLTDTSIIISTKKSLINNEIKLREEQILEAINAATKIFVPLTRNKIRIQ